jgi:alpha-tubulin suppressor-like RCC1 family protein
MSSLYRDSFSFVGNTPCMVTEAGQVMCWGENADKIAGAGTEQFQLTPAEIPDDGYQYQNVHVGMFHGCGLVASTGNARCWGVGEFLGNPDAPDFYGSFPLPVQPTHSFDVLAAGAVTTCARVEYENFQCWGRNDTGQMGDGTQTSEWGLLRPGLSAGSVDFEQVSLGPNNGCAISSEGDLYCWGRSEQGTVGNNYAGSIPQTYPAIIGYEHTWRRVAVGTDAACAITTEHELYCWGSGRYGMLALEQATTGVIAQAPQLTDLEGPVLDISLNESSGCAVMADGRMICWGTEMRVEGIDRDINENLYEAEIPEAISNFSVGRTVTCLVDYEGAAHCFGINAFGAIGNPSVPMGPGTLTSLTPVAGGHRFMTNPY